MRDLARSIVGPGDFIEIYVNAPLDICESRDVKGLYQKARKGIIKGFTGIDDPYEPPFAPELEVRTDLVELEDGVDQILAYLRPLIALA